MSHGSIRFPVPLKFRPSLLLELLGWQKDGRMRNPLPIYDGDGAQEASDVLFPPVLCANIESGGLIRLPRFDIQLRIDVFSGIRDDDLDPKDNRKGAANAHASLPLLIELLCDNLCFVYPWFKIRRCCY